ncbi:fructose-1,6-bisphosphatase [Jannaschia faecimaris]|uniref:Fructose-1,6-bisphosphatase n=1 Tax=Jannaschia faecimaris TaxID=1244108 RepID=A0A1H3U296_9RHOB|nr:inositol monophosphatase [Jannaschia faecimaris]SDZ56488.1 fructose-1,6-bisphosphatase [Jannaschia faecimaris]
MTLTTRQTDDLIEAVRDTGRKEIMPHFRNLAPLSVGTKADAKDLVTEADRAAEIAIATAVANILPQASIVGEEAVAEHPATLDAIGTSGTCVVIDPIDGTGNFVEGLAVFGTILAVVHNGETIFGLLYDPVLDDWICATRGEGAFYANDTKAPTSVAPRPARPLGTAKGFLSLDNYPATDRADILRKFDPVYQIRDIRCSCHEYRLVASGQADFLRSCSLNPWDHAAGLLILQEAGGWARVGGDRRYVPTLREGHVIAASCEQVANGVRELSVGLP